MKRLDRALCNPSWQLLFEETKVVHFLRTSSNHNPILINTLPSPPHPCNHPFHLKTMWFNNSFFPNVVNDAWDSHPDNTILTLKEFTKRTKIWNQDVFGNIFNKKKRFLACLNDIQKALCNNSSLFLLNLKKDLNLKYQHILRLEEEFWALKSKTDWTLLGDWNTQFLLPIHHLQKTPQQNLVPQRLIGKLDLFPYSHPKLNSLPLHQTLHHWIKPGSSSPPSPTKLQLHTYWRSWPSPSGYLQLGS